MSFTLRRCRVPFLLFREGGDLVLTDSWPSGGGGCGTRWYPPSCSSKRGLLLLPLPENGPLDGPASRLRMAGRWSSLDEDYLRVVVGEGRGDGVASWGSRWDSGFTGLALVSCSCVEMDLSSKFLGKWISSSSCFRCHRDWTDGTG